MTAGTDAPMMLVPNGEQDRILNRQRAARAIAPVMVRISRSTATLSSEQRDAVAYGGNEAGAKWAINAPLIDAEIRREVIADSAPLQIWEGTVIDVDVERQIMNVVLDAKLGEMSRHTGEIDLDSVSPQDLDLVVPGAVFYLTLYKRTIPNVENIEELRFRRRPSWAPSQLRRIEEDANTLRAKMRALPFAP